MRIALVALPLVLLVALFAVFAMSLDRDPNLVRSVLIDRPAPQFVLPAVEILERPGFSTETLAGEVTVVNVFASWCVPCRDEHPFLVSLKADTGVRLFGINQNDQPDNARRFLDELGNPYDAIGGDMDRRVSIDWGVYGVPETFVVDADGIVTFKHVGPITARSYRDVILPAVAAARGEG